MEDHAQALLRNHRMMESRLSVIRAKLEKAEAIEARLAEEKIQAWPLGANLLTACPAAAGKAARPST